MSKLGDAENQEKGESTLKNACPSEPYSKSMTGPLFDPKEPMIARLAEVAAKKKDQPICGFVGIQRSKEPEVVVPPECMLYESDHFKLKLPN